MSPDPSPLLRRTAVISGIPRQFRSCKWRTAKLRDYRVGRRDLSEGAGNCKLRIDEEPKDAGRLGKNTA